VLLVFVTFTCNPEWKEIKDELLPHQMSNDRPDVLARVFRMKSKQFFKDIYDNEIFGKVNGYTHVIEFQKRGLPHAHGLIILDKKDKPKTNQEIDYIVCAELPDKDKIPSLWNTVTRTMLHGPCGPCGPTAPCMADNKCSKGILNHLITVLILIKMDTQFTVEKTTDVTIPGKIRNLNLTTDGCFHITHI
jgi:hypothetical protein